MFRARRLSCLLVAAAVLLSDVGAAGASVPVPKKPRGFYGAIEAYAPYQPQGRCAPYTRPGTRKLAELLVHTYPGTTYGTTRPCNADTHDTSEHYDGRAIDWMVSVRNPLQKAYGDALVGFLLATDYWGHPHAMLRRLGIMYLIWNNRMWGSWDRQSHPYSSCASHPETAWDNTCHRTHVHISLAWKGAMGATSWWTGQVATYSG